MIEEFYLTGTTTPGRGSRPESNGNKGTPYSPKLMDWSLNIKCSLESYPEQKL